VKAVKIDGKIVSRDERACERVSPYFHAPPESDRELSDAEQWQRMRFYAIEYRRKENQKHELGGVSNRQKTGTEGSGR